MASWSKLPCWLRNALIAVALSAMFVAYNSFCYPSVWRQVRPGMTIPEVDALCGPPDYYNGITKPDMWYVEQPFGKWELRVSPLEGTGDRLTNVAGKVEVHYLPFWNVAHHIVIRERRP